MHKLLFIVVPGFRDSELFDTKDALGEGFQADIASSTMEDFAGADGTVISPNMFIENAVPEDYEGIVLIGGPGMTDAIYSDEATLSQITALLKAFSSAGKLVAAICISPVALARAGIIRGKKITCWNGPDNGQKQEIEAAGATFTGEQVTVDGKFITGNGPAAAKPFGEAISKHFAGK